METSRLSSKGQVTLPKKVRTAIGARPGDTIVYEISDDGIRLRRAEPLDLAFHAALEHTLDEWTTPADEEAFGDL